MIVPLFEGTVLIIAGFTLGVIITIEYYQNKEKLREAVK